MQSLVHIAVGLLAITSTALGHGKPVSPNQAMFRQSHEAKMRRALETCGSTLMKRDVHDARLAKREAALTEHASALGLGESGALAVRDLINSGTNASCVLTPESEEGPYYANGSIIRHDSREDQPGIPILLDVQVTDVRTCEPIEGVMLDFWNANATGVYSDMEDEGTLGTWWLRGIRKTDEYGLAQHVSIFPGFYAGRAQHMHIKAHVNYTVHDNNSTISFGAVPHTGQLFFDQSTLTQINKVPPYTLDTNTFTTNVDDRVLTSQANSTRYDPFVEIRSMGYNLTGGVLGFINLAIDPTATPGDAGTMG
ncbi:hypothetical protein B0A50_08197 [Salinomyces thailandicus]|uniref:Intradiol ring-cleavage dioxygenases domain-containing protein n=1 Tax=Salinomyces thailandicus TaxID=706561 RepID=A0A4U0TJW8_9PEZI|nr:hypothetical protein B0A50_08197 [Salinomyces thailandica]